MSKSNEYAEQVNETEGQLDRLQEEQSHINVEEDNNNENK